MDSFGEPKGDRTTVKDSLDEIIKGYWTQPVDKYGKPSKDAYRTTSRAEWMMTQVCADKFTETMKQQVTNSAGTFKDGLRHELNKIVGKLLDQAFHVKTKADKPTL